MLLNEDVEARGANIDLMDENGNMSSAVVLTDPSRTSRDFSQEGGLWIFGDSTSILNTEANDLLIAENALPDTSIRILDSSEEVIGVWEFEARPAVRSASAEENNFNAGISIVENQDGSLCVAVSEDAQTDAVLHNQMPLLTLDCTFENAAVYYNDVAVASELEEGKISFQVAGGGVYRIVDAPKTVTYVAAIGEVGYETVAEALDAARTGDVVKLTADAEEADVIVKEGITLDLNSHALTAGYVFAVNGSDIVDSSSGNTGVLVVDPDYLMISSGNSDLPIWNGEGFIFVDILNFQELYTTNAAGQKQYIFLPTFETIAHQYLVQGMENSRVKIAIRMTWEIETGSAFQNFVFNDKTVKQIIDSYANGYYSQAFYATITNSEYADFDLKVVLISDTGVELMCN